MMRVSWMHREGGGEYPRTGIVVGFVNATVTTYAVLVVEGNRFMRININNLKFEGWVEEE